MRAIICATFGGYNLNNLEDLCADEFAEVAGAALWLKDQESKAVSQHRKGKRR
jgi:hypothetical protein